MSEKTKREKKNPGSRKIYSRPIPYMRAKIFSIAPAHIWEALGLTAKGVETPLTGHQVRYTNRNGDPKRSSSSTTRRNIRHRKYEMTRRVSPMD